MFVSRILDLLAFLFTFLWELKQNSIKIFQMVQKLWSIFANCPRTDAQNLELGKASTNNKWHLTFPWARSCQYQCVCKISSQYSTCAFFAEGLGIRWLGCIGHTLKVNLQLLCRSTFFGSCNIPLNSRDKAILAFSHFIFSVWNAISNFKADLYQILYWKIKRGIFIKNRDIFI